MSASFDSKWYPYTKVIEENGLIGAEKIPYKLLEFLLDMPDSHGYTPRESNDYPRARLMRYLWYDDEKPLNNPLPTPKEKLSLLFNGGNPDITTTEEREKHPRGYRMFWQKIIGQSGTEAKTILKCYLGRIFEKTPFITTIGVRFEIWTNVNFLSNTRSDDYDRVFNIEQCIREALAGVNMVGIGTITFSRIAHTDNGSTPLYDESTNVGRALHCSVDWTDPNTQEIDGFCDSCG
mgnify:CR=1 FL=1